MTECADRAMGEWLGAGMALVLAAPTGSGKTLMSMRAIASQQGNLPVVYACETNEQVRQAARVFATVGSAQKDPRYTREGLNEWEPGAHAIVAGAGG